MQHSILKLITGIVMIAVLISVVLNACQKIPNYTNCSMQIPSLSQPVPFTTLSDSIEKSDGPLNCTTSRVKFGPQFMFVNSLDPQSTVIYPGAVIYYKSFQDGTYIPMVGPRKPLTISISLSNISGTVSQQVPSPSLSSVREAIQRILRSKANGATAANISWQQSEVYSAEHFRLSVGGNYGNLFADLNAHYKYSNKKVIGRFLFQFTQVYYTIDVDAPKPGLQNFFEGGTDCSAANGQSPVYVSSVSYGRKVFLLVESESYNYSQMADIEASFNSFFGSGGLSVEATLQRILNEKSVQGVIIGGPSYEGIEAVTNIADLKGYLLAGANFNENSPGVPLAYTMRFTNDNSIAKLAMYDEFTIRDCQIVPPTTTFFQPATVKEVRLNHISGDKEFAGHGPNVTVKVELKPSADQKEVWATVYVKMEEVGGDHTTGLKTYEVKLWTAPTGKKVSAITTQASQTFTYTDTDIFLDTYDFSVSNVIKKLVCRGDTDGDDLDLTDIESTGHLHSLSFNPIGVQLVNQ
ncbi:MAG: thiol-activated cytolysin family protein [Williamsia sp.]|nr:thiol-activated cytolysin family protein [Williamsia sp.]